MVDGDVSANAELPRLRFPEPELVSPGEGGHSRQLMEVREPGGMPPARVENILRHQLLARVPGMARIRTKRRLEEIGVKVAVDLAILSPGRERRQPLVRTRECNRRGQPRDVRVRLDP